MRKTVCGWMLLLGALVAAPGLWAADTYGPVRPDETLWVIAKQVRPDASLSVHQVMHALLRANPDAFARGNINGLKRGVTLTVPDRAAMQALDRRRASALSAEHWAAWKAGRTLAAAQPETVSAPPPAVTKTPERPPAEPAAAPAPKQAPVVATRPRLPARTGQQAGTIHLSTGKVTAATPAGDIRELGKGSAVYSGETLSTGPNSYVRVAFTDRGYVMLRPNSRFLIEDYRDTGDPATEKNDFSLLKGGFRAVTGLVSKRNRNNYRVNTAVATIGIRGTDFEGRLCNADCLDIDPPPPDGLYVGVKRSRIVVYNPAGELVLDTGQYGHVEGADVPPTSIAPPPVLEQDPIPSADPMLCPSS